METVSEKKKRGRPSVFARQYGKEQADESKKLAAFLTESAESERTVTNNYYTLRGWEILQKACPDDFKAVYFTPKGNWKAKCVAEQIGRMREQNNFTMDSCIQIAKIVTDALKKGCTVRQAEAYIRHGRNVNEW